MSWSFKQVKDKMVNKQKQVISKKKDNDNKTKCMVVVPYVEGLSQTAERIFKKHGVATAMKPNTTLRKLLVHPKDKQDLLSTTDRIYEIPCKTCKYTYIGETDRRFGTRLSEHQKETKHVESSKQNYTCASRKQSQSELSKSAIADHAVQYNHVIDWAHAKILDKECNASIWRICESMWIRRRGPQDMNRDEGGTFLKTRL